MHIHLIAVAGTGMGSLAGLFKAAGHDVSGSDMRFDPPMGPALREWGIRLLQGFDPAHLSPAPDLVVVGNVCRADNPEARAAIDGGLPVTNMAHALAEHVLEGTSPVVVAGTHGKTTTTSACAWLLHDAGLGPGFLVGGLPKNFSTSFQLPNEGATPPTLPLVATPTGRAGANDGGDAKTNRKTPFVIEGDEYDTAFFEKTPKFWHYRPEVAILTSIEHDHIDIYPTLESYLHAYIEFVKRIPSHGLLVASASDGQVVDIVRDHAVCEVAWFALQGDDTHGQAPEWLAATGGSHTEGGLDFELFVGGVASGRFTCPLPGTYNVRNAVAAMAVAMQGFEVPIHQVRDSLRRFQGVRRRQDLLGTPRGIRVVDDFAHHPTAVNETLRALRAAYPKGSLFAVFEPRSATACRVLHQEEYAQAFTAATHVLLAPLGRDTIPEDERLDLTRLVGQVRESGPSARATSGVTEIIDLLVKEARAGDTIALLSNGAFGGIHQKLLEALDR